jgi:hypothetical protein
VFESHRCRNLPIFFCLCYPIWTGYIHYIECIGIGRSRVTMAGARTWNHSQVASSHIFFYLGAPSMHLLTTYEQAHQSQQRSAIYITPWNMERWTRQYRDCKNVTVLEWIDAILKWLRHMNLADIQQLRLAVCSTDRTRLYQDGE